MLATALLACLIVALTSAAAETRVSSSTAQPPPSATLAAIERLGVWWQRPRQPLDIRPYLPAARPVQPWPYRPLSSAQHAAVTQSRSTYALTGVVQHAPLKGVTAAMLRWWWDNIDGEAVNVGDGKVWSKYLLWHPRDHIHHIARPASSSSKGPYHEICEFFMCSEPHGYTTANYPQQQQEGVSSSGGTLQEYVIKEVTLELRPQQQQAGGAASSGSTSTTSSSSSEDNNSFEMTVPTRLGVRIGRSVWMLQHTWQDSSDGLLVTSIQRVGTVQPGWRPLWYARLRNALVRGMFGQGRDPVWMLEQWLHHCVEEIGNLEHILPGLYHSGGGEGGDEGESAAAEEAVAAERLVVDEL